MSSHISGNSLKLNNVYIDNVGTTAGLLEFDGPLGNFFDKHYDDFYFKHKCYQSAEIAMLQDAIDITLEKTDLNIDLCFGGDLNNQITATYYASRNLDRPVIGLYGACSTIALAINNAACMVENNVIANALAFTVSHNATAERQFRYPLEYGIQRKETTTFTATGATSVILTNKPRKIRVSSITFGKVVDLHQDDPNDMGRAMVPAAFDTLKQHFKDLQRDYNYYDLVLTGDLSKYGREIMKTLLEKENIKINYNDCGCLLYEENQDVYQGGSGPVCSGLVTFGYIYKLMMKNKLKRVLVIPTGALLSPVMTNQKQTIPCIAHAFSLEVA